MIVSRAYSQQSARFSKPREVSAPVLLPVPVTNTPVYSDIPTALDRFEERLWPRSDSHVDRFPSSLRFEMVSHSNFIRESQTNFIFNKIYRKYHKEKITK